MKTMRIDSIKIEKKIDENPDLSYLGEYSDTPKTGAIDLYPLQTQGPQYHYFNPANPEYAQQDFERMKAYSAGEWGCIGICAAARVSYDCGAGCRRIQIFRSGGLWGICDDNPREYIQTIEEEELLDLKQHLAAFGIDMSTFPADKIERL